MVATDRRPRGFARRLASIVLGAAMVGVGLAGTARVARADDPSDIPGIPLPGPIVTGILGGPVYDVVYQVDLAPGSIIVVSLSGSPGTDFDLYLFDASATTVVTNQGVVARSTGPTSSESLAYGTATGGRFYIDLNGATEAQGAFTLTVQTAVDHTPPALAVTLEGGRPVTNTSTVAVTLDAIDDLSTVADMAFSVDGTTFGPWQHFASPATVILPPGDGPRSAWAKVRNAVGLESAIAVDSILVDTDPPEVVGVSPDAGAHVPSLRPTFWVTFDEPIDPASWAADGLLVQRADGSRVSGRTTVDASGARATFTPDADLPAGSAVLVTLGPVTDLAGNPVPVVPSWTIVPVIPAAIAARPDANPVARGTVVELSGTYRGSVPAPGLTLAARVGGETTFGSPTEVPVAADGTFRVTVHPSATTTYRLAAPETFAVAAAQADVTVAVRRDLRLLARGATTGTTRAGAAVAVAATAGPPAAGLAVTFRLYRWSTATRAWRLVSTRARLTTASGAAATGWRPTYPGRYRWRATVSGTVDYSTAYSNWVSWTVTR